MNTKAVKTMEILKLKPLKDYTMAELKSEIERRPDERVENFLLDIRESMRTITNSRKRRNAIEDMVENIRYTFEDYEGEWVGNDHESD